MKTEVPQISQITQTAETGEVRPWGYKGVQNGRLQPGSHNLCNLRNLWKESNQENV